MAEILQYEVDGVTRFVHDADTLKEYLRLLDIDIETVKSMFYEEIEEEIEDSVLDDYRHGRRDLGCDGLLGDAFYMYQDSLKSEIDDLENDIYESLLSSRHKNNTKADIAHRLKNIIDNLRYLV